MNTGDKIKTETVMLPVGDGTEMDAYVAYPEGPGPWPGLIVLQEIFGVNAHIRDVTERFAREGFLAIAPALFHRLAPKFEGSYSEIPACIALAQKTTDEGLAHDLRATWTYLSGHAALRNGKIGAIGYCMGGRQAFRANLVLPLAAAVSYYGANIPGLLPQVKDLSGPMLFVWAGKDNFIPPQAQQEVTESLRSHGKPFVNIEFSSVDHGFFCDARSNYDAGATAQVWPLTLAFLRTHLGG